MPTRGFVPAAVCETVAACQLAVSFLQRSVEPLQRANSRFRSCSGLWDRCSVRTRRFVPAAVCEAVAACQLAASFLQRSVRPLQRANSRLLSCSGLWDRCSVLTRGFVPAAVCEAIAACQLASEPRFLFPGGSCYIEVDRFTHYGGKGAPDVNRRHSRRI